VAAEIRMSYRMRVSSSHSRCAGPRFSGACLRKSNGGYCCVKMLRRLKVFGDREALQSFIAGIEKRLAGGWVRDVDAVQ